MYVGNNQDKTTISKKIPSRLASKIWRCFCMGKTNYSADVKWAVERGEGWRIYISFNLFKTSSLYEIYNNRLAQMNDWQKTLYEFLQDFPMKDELREGLQKAILATPIQNMREFTIARDAMLRILHDVQDRKLTIQTTLRAVYKGAYDKAIVRLKVKDVEPQHISSKRPVPFYDWLTMRE